MQIPILSGIYADVDANYRTAYPVNLQPIPKNSGMSMGYLRSARGLTELGTGPGVCRGAIEWNGVCYRVLGNQLCSVAKDGTVSQIGEIDGFGPVTMDYGFDYLAIAGGNKLYLYDGRTLRRNLDGDLGVVLDVVWIDGYYVTTDGESLVSTELLDPFAVSPFKYGSSEEDADPVLAVKKLGSELYAINRHTIETFTNVGATGFPFDVIDGTQTFRGAVGTHAVTSFMGQLAFVGSGRNEAPGVYMSASGASAPISTSEIETQLAKYTDLELSRVVCEAIMFERRELLYIHLPDQTLVFDGGASAALGQPVWFALNSNESGYRGRYMVWCNNQWTVADTQSNKIGIIDDASAQHWGENVAWEFTTPIIYNEGGGVICHEVTLQALTGGVASGAQIGLEFSENGVDYSQRVPITLGTLGGRSTPIKWTRVGHFRERGALRISGDSNCRLSMSRLDARLEPCAW